MRIRIAGSTAAPFRKFLRITQSLRRRSKSGRGVQHAIPDRIILPGCGGSRAKKLN
jgi:hypothetical protein